MTPGKGSSLLNVHVWGMFVSVLVQHVPILSVCVCVCTCALSALRVRVCKVRSVNKQYFSGEIKFQLQIGKAASCSRTHPNDWCPAASQIHLQSWSGDTSWCLRCWLEYSRVPPLEKHGGNIYIRSCSCFQRQHRINRPLLTSSANALMDLVSDKSSFLMTTFSFPVSSKMSVRASSALSRSLHAITMRAPETQVETLEQTQLLTALKWAQMGSQSK